MLLLVSMDNDNGAGLLILTGLGTYEVKKVQRRWNRDDISEIA
jgi:hypothetical protein